MAGLPALENGGVEKPEESASGFEPTTLTASEKKSSGLRLPSESAQNAQVVSQRKEIPALAIRVVIHGVCL